MVSMIFRNVFVVSLFFLCIPALCSSAIIYVDQDATGTNNGSSWADAFVDFQDGLSAAVSGDEIWVAEGVYKPSVEVVLTGDRYRSFQMKNGVEIYGGFNGTENERSQRDWNTNLTVLSCDIGIEGDETDNCYHVFNHMGSTPTPTGETPKLDGFTITGGNANGENAHFKTGGGIYNKDGFSPSIQNCKFYMNLAVGSGGAIANTGTPLNIKNCVFEDNIAGGGGGAIFNVGNLSTIVVEESLFLNNTGGHGGAISDINSNSLYAKNIIKNNMAEGSGGGAQLYNGNQAIINSLFIGNTAAIEGGGIWIDNYGNPSIINCTLYGNSASQNGGGIIVHTVYLDTFIDTVYQVC